MQSWRRVAVLLSGCGVHDGSEILEATSLLFSLHKHKLAFDCFAPDKDSFHVINHLTGDTSSDKRNVLVESARIARGKIKPLQSLMVSDYDGLVMPGGFGAAKNLSNYATTGSNLAVSATVEKLIKDFHAGNKPIAACCISPILLAKVIKGVKITLGSKGEGFPYAEAIEHAKALGAEVELKDVGEVCIDENKKVLTTPAFMKDAENYYEVYQGNEKLIEELSKII